MTSRSQPTSSEDDSRLARTEGELGTVFVDRTRWLIILFTLFTVVVLARLILAQILTLTNPTERASAETIDTSRGRIVDRNGLLLATDTFTWNIIVSPEPYRQNQEDYEPEDLAGFAAELGVPLEALTTALAQPGNFAYVAKDVTQAQCAIADESEKIPTWISCEPKRRRSYPQAGLGAHIVGAANGEQLGLVGVEGYYNNWLSTSGDWPLNQLPAAEQPLPDNWKGVLPSPGGRDVVLHLSAPLQYLAERRLVEALRKYEAAAGTIIVMDPRTGGILAMANWPAYDPNQFAAAGSKEVINSAVGAIYEPGSVFKLVTYGAALDSGRITPDDQFEDTGSITVGGAIIKNSQNRQKGWVTARQALAESLNTISAGICLDMGPDVFYRYLRQFGFGRPTEVDLDSEAPGIVNRPGTRNYSTYDQAATSYGQGITVTPLQMVNAVAAIANHGTLLQPQVVQALVYDGTLHNLPPRTLGQAISPETASTLTQMMVYTVDKYVSGGEKLVPGFKVAGKTGTAEIPEQKGYTSPLTITSFVGFLPAADPQLVILVKLVEPHTSRWAEQVVLPVFGEIARDAVQVMKIAPNNEAP